MRNAGTLVVLLGLLGAGGVLLLSGGDVPRGIPGAGSGRDVLYQYVDDAGSVHFARSLEQVPEAWRDRAGRVEIDRQETAPGASREPARAAPQVVVYTTSWCGWCRRTLAWLDSKGIAYDNRDIEERPAYRDELIRKSGGTSIPVVEIDGKIIRGFDAKQMARLLRTS
jgi:glutaredoxin